MKAIPSRLLTTLLTQFIILICQAQDKLSGTANVSPTGAAVYSVAINAPKGAGNLMPSIGIAYNSQAGNGLAGFGCNITGISAITRGMKDDWHDSTVGGIKYASNDAYYLDGKRLMLKSGTAGQDGAVYAPDGEPLTEVTFHGSGTSVYFTVDAHDGMTYEYGKTASERQMLYSPSAIAAWYISKASNPLGQAITYQYNTQNLYLYPLTINYGGDNTIVFEYENRPDTISFAIRNTRGYICKRLKNIKTKAGSSVFRTYNFSYNATSDASTTKLSRLTSIHETGENGLSSHDLTASWNYLPNYLPSCNDLAILFPSSNGYEVYREYYMLSGDLNADGISDIIRVANVWNGEDGNNYTYAHISFSKMENGEIAYEVPIRARYFYSTSFGEWTFLRDGMLISDFDGDGINDLFLPNYSGGNSAIMYFCAFFGEEFKNSLYSKNLPYINLETTGDFPLYSIIDINHDGKSELIALEKTSSGGKYALHLAKIVNKDFIDSTVLLTLTSAPKHLFTSDFNNDGLIDIIVVCEDGYRIFYNQGGTLLSGLFVNSSTLNTQITNPQHISMGDFNGDGYPDFVWGNRDSYDLYFELGNGNGTFTRQLACTLPMRINIQNQEHGTWNCIVTDLDHDGKSDIVLNAYDYWQEKAYTCWLCSNGTSLSLKKVSTSSRMDDAKPGHVFSGDFKGRGYPEIANYGYDCYNGVNANVNPTLHIYSCGSQNVSNGKVSNFTDSNGRKTFFSYASLASGNLYTKGTGSTYPVIDLAAPLTVTSQIRESGASSVSSQTDYSYSGLRAHMKGRGLLGFQGISASEYYSGKTVSTATVLDNASLMPSTVTTVTTQGGMTSTAVGTMTLQQLATKNWMSYPVSQAVTDFYGNTTTTSYQYNYNLGQLLQERTEYDNSSMYKQVQYTYSAAKIAGAYRPTEILQSQKHVHSGTPFSRKTVIAYNSNGLRSSVVEDATSSLPLTTTYQYDSQGNVTQESKSGPGISAPVTTSYQYGSNGKFLTRKTDAATTVSYTRNVFGDMTAETDVTNPSNPLTTSYTRNGFGTLNGIQKHSGEHTIYTREASSLHNAAYCITELTAPVHEVKTWYDALGNMTYTSTNGIANVDISEAITYNPRGEITNKTTVHGELTTTEHYTYDALGRLLTMTSSSGTSISNSYGNRTVTTTQNGRTTTKTYDAWGNVTASQDPISSVSYSYHSNGQPSAVTSEGATVSMTYDTAGNQTSLADPDAGTTTYSYDALHRIISQTDARGYETSFVYDGASRLTSKTIDGTATTYTYSAGRLSQEQTAGRTASYAYDNQGRLSQETRTMNGESPITFGYHYDSYGRLSGKDYPQGVSVSYVYDDHYSGQHIATQMGTRCLRLLSKDNGLQATSELGGTLAFGFRDAILPENLNLNPILPQGGPYPDYPVGPGDTVSIDPVEPYPFEEEEPPVYYTTGTDMTVASAYDSRGYLMRIDMQRNDNVVHRMTYSFEGNTGNLLSRSGMCSLPEAFAYDDLDRLTGVTMGGTTRSVGYHANGNISSKTGLGSFYYGSNHPHAVTGVGSQGSIPTASQTATYTPFGKVATLSEDGYTMTFTYGPDEQRWKTVLQHNGATVRTTLYAGDYERITENGTTRHIYYLDDGVIYVLESGDTEGEFYYTYTDHLGSITRIYNETGTTVFSAEYDAWGNQTLHQTNGGFTFHRGYTGHEMLPEFGLINMNGRLYDPMLGRFLSPDNYVQMPDFSQSFNRYSYCINNPLKYNDPDGELFGLDDAFLIFGLASGALMGAAQADMNGGNFWAGALKGLVTSALSTIGTAGIGQALGHAAGTIGTELLRAGLHGLNNGIISAINGNNFGTGFLTGAMSSFAGSGAQMAGFSSLGVIASSTITGSLTSALLGGNWLEGAMTGMNNGMYNHEGKVIKHGDGTYEAVDPLPGPIIYPNHNNIIIPHILYEKPLRMVHPEFYILFGIRNVFNFVNLPRNQIVFGQNANQTYHTYRHIDEIGLERAVVRKAIESDIKPKLKMVVENKPYNGIITVDGHKLQYTIFKIDKYRYNVGRINSIK